LERNLRSGPADRHSNPSELTVQLDGIDSTPAIGYPFAKQLLARKYPFTALFAYNDISAIGSLWAFREAGLRVPEDISIVGFDDIPGAAYANPGLTTVRQPLQKMGRIAAQTVVELIEGRGKYVPEIAIEPEFVIRQSTGPLPSVRYVGLRQARHSYRTATQPNNFLGRRSNVLKRWRSRLPAGYSHFPVPSTIVM